MEIGEVQTTPLSVFFFFFFEKKSYGSYQTAVKELLLTGTIQLDITDGPVFWGEYSPAQHGLGYMPGIHCLKFFTIKSVLILYVRIILSKPSNIFFKDITLQLSVSWKSKVIFSYN